MIALNGMVNPKCTKLPFETQLDDIRPEVIAQTTKILQLQDIFEKSLEKTEFYRRQAAQADLVPSRRRYRLVSSDADNILTPDELFQQLVLARDDIQVRNRALERLQVQHTQRQASFELCLLHLRSFLRSMLYCLNNTSTYTPVSKAVPPRVKPNFSQ